MVMIAGTSAMPHVRCSIPIELCLIGILCKIMLSWKIRWHTWCSTY